MANKKRKKKTVYKKMNNKVNSKPFKLEEILQQKIVKQYLVAYAVGCILNFLMFIEEKIASPFDIGIILWMMLFKALIDVYSHPEWSKAYAMGHGGKAFVKVGIIWLFYIALAFLFDLFGLDIRPFLGLATKIGY